MTLHDMSSVCNVCNEAETTENAIQRCALCQDRFYCREYAPAFISPNNFIWSFIYGKGIPKGRLVNAARSLSRAMAVWDHGIIVLGCMYVTYVVIFSNMLSTIRFQTLHK